MKILYCEEGFRRVVGSIVGISVAYNLLKLWDMMMLTELPTPLMDLRQEASFGNAICLRRFCLYVFYPRLPHTELVRKAFFNFI